MDLLLSTSDLLIYIRRLLECHFPIPSLSFDLPPTVFRHALDRLEFCFSRIKLKYYIDSSGQTVFDPLNGDHFCMFLWFLANSLHLHTSDELLPSLLSQLNKRLHCLDLFYSVSMPDIFLLVHPVGSVFGNASYSDYFVGYQSCTIGADGPNYPQLGSGVVCYSNSSIIGNCKIGNDVVFAANSFLLNSSVQEMSIVTGHFPNNRIHTNTQRTRARIFKNH